MRLTDRVTRFAITLRERPKVAAATAATALAAIVAGGALAMALDGPREVGLAPTPTETASPSATPTASQPSTPVPPSPTPAPTASPTLASTPAPAIRPTLAPTPTPTAPEGGHGGPITGSGPYEDPSWDMLPAMPNGEAHAINGVVVLDDGRLVAFREANDRSGWSAMSIREGDTSWTSIPLTGLDAGRIYAFTLGPDGRIYTDALVIDPTSAAWIAVDAGWDGVFETAVVGTGPDGLLYGANNDGTLAVLDPATGDSGRTSANTASREPSALSFEALLPGDTEVLAIDLATVVAYSPESDGWRLVADWPWHFARRAGIGPDGHIFIMADDEEGRAIHRLDPTTSEWVDVPRPYEAWADWTPYFVTGPDGRIWAVGASQVFALESE